MHFGIHLFASEHSMQPDELAGSAEERGFELVWFSEHTHVPVKCLNAGENGPALPDYYWQIYDPFIAAALAAAASKTIKVGTGVSLVIEHDPITLAKKVATIDRISAGRFLFGIGAGWIPEELENHGVTYRTRYRLLAEQIAAMKKIWSQDEAELHGEFVNFSKLKSYPKPTQRPHPPILARGGTGPKALENVIYNCAGWMPFLEIHEWHNIKNGVAELRQRASAIGPDPASIEVTISCYSPPDHSTKQEMQSMGIKRLVISLEGKNRVQALPLLDQYAELIDE